MMISENQQMAVLNGIQAEIHRMALAAFARLIDQINAGNTSRAAINAIQAGFTGEYKDALLQAFNQVLVSSMGSTDLDNLQIGGLKLADRIYQESRSVTATAHNIINQHARGFHDARKLALQLYEGYGFRANEPINVRVPLPAYLRSIFGDDTAFQALWRNEYTASTLNALLNNGFTGPELAQVYARIKATQLKTPALKAAYLQALDAIKNGSGQRVLNNALKTAFHERNRYFVNRIAQTELHRVYTDQQAVEIMADDAFAYVQIKMSQTHPATDICDLHANLNKYGLGPGVYPKAQAPKPPFHPFCRCVAHPKAFVEGKQRINPSAEIDYLNGKPYDEARQIIGSRDKLAAMRAGVGFDKIVNSGVDPLYHLKRLGEFGGQG